MSDGVNVLVLHCLSAAIKLLALVPECHDVQWASNGQTLFVTCYWADPWVCVYLGVVTQKILFHVSKRVLPLIYERVQVSAGLTGTRYRSKYPFGTVVFSGSAFWSAKLLLLCLRCETDSCQIPRRVLLPQPLEITTINVTLLQSETRCVSRPPCE
jgi:hypothetical protein